ncbi:TPA: hypothetical protein N0F65_006762 [Lagenidium giganteum]|uniref:Uncharacterized protein n=1 Tax=Lagenidium giganteum TaxID=4803 RepID=A0AAV2YX56_9STRA|nr:TPA: hypothetical protein N0F65_006762 [Lagenidium giganteum]
MLDAVDRQAANKDADATSGPPSSSVLHLRRKNHSHDPQVEATTATPIAVSPSLKAARMFGLGQPQATGRGAANMLPAVPMTTSAPQFSPFLSRAVSSPADSMEARARAATAALTTPLSVVSEDAPPRVAIRFGDSIRLFAKSKYVCTNKGGGYVGTFDKRFLQPKNNQKQGELACLPPVQSSGALVFRPSTFRIVSPNADKPPGHPVCYGDVIVLVDEHDRVWNNKIGVGPTTLNGYFGPREQNTPGEMYVMLHQVRDDRDGGDDDDSSSESSDEEDGFLSLSNVARTTKSMVESFSRPSNDATMGDRVLPSAGKVLFYGDRNVIIEVHDSNRIRSKFNRVITHYRKNDGLVVQGGYLRCDGRGKSIKFELHGLSLPSIESIVVTELDDSDTPTLDRAEEMDTQAERDPPHTSVVDTGDAPITFGKPVSVRDVYPSSVLSLTFSDGGSVAIPCKQFIENEGQVFHRVVHGGLRPNRIQVQARRQRARRRTVDIRETWKGTYRELLKLFGFVFVLYSLSSYIALRIFGPVVFLPACYFGVVIAVAVFLVELFSPGKLIASRQLSLASQANKPEKFPRDWFFTVLALEASASERTGIFPGSDLGQGMDKDSSSDKIPKAFIMAENGNYQKGAERYMATMAWREEMNADHVLEEPQKHYYAIKSIYKQFLHKRDKVGHPVYFEKIGSINMKQMQKSGVSSDDLFRHYLFAIEFTLKYVACNLCPCDACGPSETQKMFIVLDARGIGMRDMGGENAEFIRKCTSIMQKHYPQRSFKIFIVNVPSWFGMAWKGVKPLLNEATRAKTNILSENDTAAALLEFIDADSLPVEYGGICSCPGGCEENSAFQRLQKCLVDSVLAGKPFCPDDPHPDAIGQCAERMSDDEFCGPSRPLCAADLEDLNRFSLDGSCPRVHPATIPPFREEVLKVGVLLKRSLKIKHFNHFNPIWHRRFFILHPDSLRFGKSVNAEIFQIVNFTADTIVRKTQKQNNTLELITPLMASNGHALLLCANSPDEQQEWVDALTQAIARLRPTAHVPDPPKSDDRKTDDSTANTGPRASLTKAPRSKSFWDQFPEKEELNQYWYSRQTVETLGQEVLEATAADATCAFLSTPSVYYEVKRHGPSQLKCFLFDFDEKFASEGSGFVLFDFNKPLDVPDALRGSCDIVVIDPPFITREVWEKYATTAKLLLRPGTGKVLLSTIQENADMMHELMGCAVQKFKPSIPHLVYQYALFANYETSKLRDLNPEVDDEI